MLSFRFAVLSLLAIIFLSACAEEKDPTETTMSYFKALVESDSDTARRLSCAAWEEEAQTQVDSFRGRDAVLKDVTCKEDGKDGDYTQVTCEGKIKTTYDGEVREWPLSSYRMKKEDGEWRFCGMASNN